MLVCMGFQPSIQSDYSPKAEEREIHVLPNIALVVHEDRVDSKHGGSQERGGVTPYLSGEEKSQDKDEPGESRQGAHGELGIAQDEQRDLVSMKDKGSQGHGVELVAFSLVVFPYFLGV